MSKPTIIEVLPIVQGYYNERPENGCGGSLHIVLDDGNVDDSSVKFCIDTARQRCDESGVKLAQLLLQMSKTQRKKLYVHPRKRCFPPLSIHGITKTASTFD